MTRKELQARVDAVLAIGPNPEDGPSGTNRWAQGYDDGFEHALVVVRRVLTADTAACAHRRLYGHAPICVSCGMDLR